MASLATNILRGETSPEHLDEILSRGPEIADLSFRDPLGRSLVHIASACGEVQALRWLLGRGADIEATTVPGEDTVLHLAASEGHLDTVRYLLEEAGIEISGVNAAGESALDVAIDGGFDGIVRTITRHIRPPPPIARQASAACSSEIMEGNMRDCPPSFREVNSTGQHLPLPQEGRLGGIPHEAALHTTDSAEWTNPCPEKIISTASSSHTKKHGPRIAPFGGRGVTSGGFFIAGAWSKAGIRSCFNVRHAQLLDRHGIVFDMGVSPCEVVNVQHVFVTHGHLDHCGAVVSHARLRLLAGLSRGKYYMHAELAEGTEKVRQAFEAIEGDAIPMDITAIGPDDSVDLGKGCFVRPFLVQHRKHGTVRALVFSLPTAVLVTSDDVGVSQGSPATGAGTTHVIRGLTARTHCPYPPIVACGTSFTDAAVKALGFALIRRQTAGLKQEFRDLDGKTLGDLKRRGVEISTYREAVEVVYTGDTVMSPLVSLPQVWRAKLLIMEVSYLDGDRTAAEQNHHIHIQDLLDNMGKLEGVEKLVVAHVSGRYAPYQNVLRLLGATLPPSIVHKVSVALGEFGAPGHLTFLEDFGP